MVSLDSPISATLFYCELLGTVQHDGKTDSKIQFQKDNQITILEDHPRSSLYNPLTDG